MNNLLIIGARGWGREVYCLAKYCKGYETEFIVKGFLDDKVDALNGLSGYPPIIDSVEKYDPQKGDVFICALGDNNWRKYYAEIILNKGGRFINLIHRNSYIGQNSTMGIGCIVSDLASVSCDVVIGNFVTIQRLVDLGHDVRVGSYCTLGTKSFLGGYSEIGDYTIVHTGAIILPHVNVENNCTIGAGSVVLRRVKSGNTVYGNPAKILNI